MLMAWGTFVVCAGVIGLAQLVHVFNCRSERLSLFQLGVGTNRALV